MLRIGLSFSDQTGSDYGEAYQAILDKATTEGYTHPTEDENVINNTHIENLISLGIWSELDGYMLLKGGGDLSFATLNAKDPANSDSASINSPTYETGDGVHGDAVSAYIETGFIPSTHGGNYQLTNASYGGYMYKAQDTTITGKRIMSTGDDFISLMPKQDSFSRTEAYININAADLRVTTVTNQIGFWHIDRIGTANSMLLNGVLLDSAVNTATNLSPNELTLFKSVNKYSNGGLSVVFWGGSLYDKRAAFNTEVQRYINDTI